MIVEEFSDQYSKVSTCSINAEKLRQVLQPVVRF